jgi:flagellar motor switch protein FliM
MRLSQWLADGVRSANKFLAERWAVPLELHLERVQQVAPATALSTMAESAVCCQLHLNGDGAYPAFLIFDRPTILMLLAAALSDQVADWPEDRELTEIERTLTSCVVEQFLEPFSLSWPQSEPLRFAIAATGPRKTICRNATDEPGWTASFSFRGSIGTKPLVLLLPRSQGFMAQIGSASPDSSSNPALKKQTEALLLDTPLNMTVVLGSVKVSVQELTRLAVGDLVILDQLIDAPLSGQVEGTDKFQVCAGAIGQSQAVRIQAFTNARA